MANLRKLLKVLVLLLIAVHAAALPAAAAEGADQFGVVASAQGELADPGQDETPETGADHVKPCQDHCQAMPVAAGAFGPLHPSVLDPTALPKLASAIPSLAVPPPQ